MLEEFIPDHNTDIPLQLWKKSLQVGGGKEEQKELSNPREKIEENIL